MLRQYDDLFATESPEAEAARWVARNSRDICELLVDVGIQPPSANLSNARVIGYHDACHLVHGCGVDRAPREVLTATGVRWFDLGENTVCCGSAGAYNLLHPHVASDLAQRKVHLAAEAGATDIAVGNIGCIMQLERAFTRAHRSDVAVWHPIELLDEAYRRESRE